MEDAFTTAELEDMLWSIIVAAGHDTGLTNDDGICLPAMLNTAAQRRCLPSDTEMEKLERKATIARTLFARYARDWTARLGEAKAPPEVLVGTTALFLLDAALATDRARALKRLNAALRVMEMADWCGDAPVASKIAVVAERLTVALTRGSV